MIVMTPSSEDTKIATKKGKFWQVSSCIYVLIFVLAQLNNWPCSSAGSVLCSINNWMQAYAFPMQFDLLSHYLSGVYFDGSRHASIIVFAIVLVPFSALMAWMLLGFRRKIFFAGAYLALSLLSTGVLWLVVQLS